MGGRWTKEDASNIFGLIFKSLYFDRLTNGGKQMEERVSSAFDQVEVIETINWITSMRGSWIEEEEEEEDEIRKNGFVHLLYLFINNTANTLRRRWHFHCVVTTAAEGEVADVPFLATN